MKNPLHITNRAFIWLLLNFAGIAVYLRAASVLWPAPEDQGFPGGPGDAFYWVLTVFPLWLVFLFTNVTALVHLWRTRKRSPKSRVTAWLLVAMIWLVALGYDSHRSRHVEPQYSSASQFRAGVSNVAA